MFRILESFWNRRKKVEIKDGLGIFVCGTLGDILASIWTVKQRFRVLIWGSNSIISDVKIHQECRQPPENMAYMA